MARTRSTNHAVVERELEQHDPRLASLPRVLALSKADLVTDAVASAAASQWRSRLGAVAVLVTSSATRLGLDALAAELSRGSRRSRRCRGVTLEEAVAEHVTFRPASGRGFRVERGEDGVFRVIGTGIDLLVARHDLDNDEALAHIETRLRQIGVIRALQEAGFAAGDDVEIGGVLFDLDA